MRDSFTCLLTNNFQTTKQYERRYSGDQFRTETIHAACLLQVMSPGGGYGPSQYCMGAQDQGAMFGAGSTAGAQTPSQHHNMFPSMSVNVSMNMTMHGYPTNMSDSLQHQMACPQVKAALHPTPWTQLQLLMIKRTSWPESSSDRRLSAKLMPTFADRGASRRQRDWSLQPYSRFLDWSRYFLYQNSSSVVLTRLNAPNSRPTTSQKIW
jgi:hypothetical protein